MTDPVTLAQFLSWLELPEARAVKWVVPFINPHTSMVVRIEALPYHADVKEAGEGDLLELLSYKINKNKQGSALLNFRCTSLLG
jgi:hypothetical protein